MGIFDSLEAKLLCPQTGIEAEREIQFKFSKSDLGVYHLGDQLDYGPYGNLWIPESYICDSCSTEESKKANSNVEDGVSKLKNSPPACITHDVYIHLDNGNFLEVLAEKEFQDKYGLDGEMLPDKERLW